MVVRMHQWMAIWTAMIALAMASPAQADLIYIDDFNDTESGSAWGVQLGEDVGQPADQTHTLIIDEAGLNVIGGTRQTSASAIPRNVVTGVHNDGVVHLINPASGGGAFAGRTGFYKMSSTGNGLGAFSLLYDAGGSGLDLDLTSAQSLGLSLYVDHLGFGAPSRIAMTLSDGQHESEVAFEWNAPPADLPSGFWDLEFTLSDFADGDPLLDVGNIQSIELNYLGDVGNDVSIDSIWTQGDVPEPGSLLLFAAGCLLMTKRPRRALTA